jgi:hypothetical protein
MTIDQVVSRFGPMSPEDQAKALGGVSYHFTIIGREVSLQGSCQEQRDKLVALNELQHKLTSQALAILQGAKRYSDRDFIAVLESMSTQTGMSQFLLAAFMRVL